MPNSRSSSRAFRERFRVRTAQLLVVFGAFGLLSCSAEEAAVDAEESAPIEQSAFALPADATDRAFYCVVAATSAQDSLPESDTLGRLRAQLREMQWANIAVQLNGPIENAGHEARLLAGRARQALRDNPDNYPVAQIREACAEAFPQTQDSTASSLPESDLELASACMFTIEEINGLQDGSPAVTAYIGEMHRQTTVMLPILQRLTREALVADSVDSEEELYRFQDAAVSRGYAIAAPEKLIQLCRSRFEVRGQVSEALKR